MFKTVGFPTHTEDVYILHLRRDVGLLRLVTQGSKYSNNKYVNKGMQTKYKLTTFNRFCFGGHATFFQDEISEAFIC